MKRSITYYLLLFILAAACDKDKHAGVVEKKCVLSLQPGPGESKSAVIWSAFPDDTIQAPYIISYYGSWRGTEGVLKSLFSFDLSYISTDAEIDSAFIYLYNDPAYSIQRWDQAKLSRIEEVWDKSIVTWTNQPSIDEVSKINLGYSGQKNYKANITDDVAYWVKNPAMNSGLMMSIDPEIHNNALVFASGSHPTQSLRPKLEIHYRVAVNKECNCQTHDKPDSVIVTDSISIQPNSADGIDTYLASSDPDLAGGSSMQFSCGTGAGSIEFRSLIRFDVSLLKNVVEVEQAMLYLSFYYNGKDTVCDDAELLPVGGSWNPATVTWNMKPASSIIGKISIPQALPRSGAVVDITSLAAGWILYPHTNFGMELRIKDPLSVHTRMFCSSNYTDPAKRPRLVVKYKHRVVNK